MNEIEICIPFIVAILSVGYPILFQVISKLDEKYNSAHILKLFKEEKTYSNFKGVLYITLITVLLYLGGLFLSEHGWTDKCPINLSLVLLTAGLALTFIFLSQRVLKYYTVDSLVKYLIRGDKETAFDSDQRLHFLALSDLLQKSIKDQNEKIAQTISKHFYASFCEYREKCTENEQGVVYPEIYYDAVYQVTLNLLMVQDNKLKFLENRAPGGIWLLGEFAKKKVSEDTYIWMWRNLRLVVEYKKDDIILSYWGTAFQYAGYSLLREKTNKEHDRFLQFNYALGALLLHQKRHDCLRRIFQFTNSQPPKYTLFPSTMQGVWEQFLELNNSYSHDLSVMAFRYNFPHTEGIKSSDLMLHWMRKYMAVLFLRQYTLHTYHVHQNPVSLNNLPDTQADKRKWMDSIEPMKSYLDEIRSNTDLMQELGFGPYDNLSDAWCKSQDKLNPTELFDNLKQRLKDSFQTSLIEQTLSEEQVSQFNESTKRIITNLFAAYTPIYAAQPIEKDYKSWHLNCHKRMVLDKSSFADSQEVYHANYDTILAEELVRDIRSSVAEQFYLKRTASYLLKSGDLFKGVDKLIEESKDYLMVAFGLSMSYWRDEVMCEDGKYTYKGIEICELAGSSDVVQSLFVLRKADLVYFVFNSPTGIDIKKYQLKEIDSSLNLYTGVVDLNTDQALCDELKNMNRTGVNLRTKVLATTALDVECRWKNEMELVHFQVDSIYQERGIVNSPQDVISLE